jgi:hypothetical protein
VQQPSVAVPGRPARCVHKSRPLAESAAATDWRVTMLTTILVLLLVLWLLGLVSSYTLGGFIHILLILAIALVLIRIIQGRRPI